MSVPYYLLGLDESQSIVAPTYSMWASPLILQHAEPNFYLGKRSQRERQEARFARLDLAPCTTWFMRPHVLLENVRVMFSPQSLTCPWISTSEYFFTWKSVFLCACWSSSDVPVSPVFIEHLVSRPLSSWNMLPPRGTKQRSYRHMSWLLCNSGWFPQDGCLCIIDL